MIAALIALAIIVGAGALGNSLGTKFKTIVNKVIGACVRLLDKWKAEQLPIMARLDPIAVRDLADQLVREHVLRLKAGEEVTVLEGAFAGVEAEIVRAKIRQQCPRAAFYVRRQDCRSEHRFPQLIWA